MENFISRLPESVRLKAQKIHEGGGTESIYNDHPEDDGITEYVTKDGEHIPITSNVVIRESTYELGLTAEYRRLLEFPEIWLKATTPFR